MTSVIRPAGIALALALAGCSAEPAQQAPTPVETQAANVDPDSGLELIDVTVTTDEGSHTFVTEIAATPEQQQRGMMFRNEMGADEGMLFPYDQAADRGFWMRNTFIPLDIIFIAEDGTIINIGEGEPYNEESVRSEAPAIAVFEIPGGRSEELGIEPGDRVSW